MSDQPIKATRSVITFGEISFNGYQLPNSSYKVSTQTFKQTLKALIGDSTGKKYLKPILEASKSRVESVKIKDYNRPITLYGLDTFSEVVAAYAKLGNKNAIAILVACMEESLERRFDRAFGVEVSEVERDIKLARKLSPVCTKTHRKNVRKLLVNYFDKADKLRNEGVPFGKWISTGKEITILINQAVFGVDHFNCDRDFMTKDQQYAIAEIEDYLFLEISDYRRPRYEDILREANKAVTWFKAKRGDYYHVKNKDRHEKGYLDW